MSPASHRPPRSRFSRQTKKPPPVQLAYGFGVANTATATAIRAPSFTLLNLPEACNDPLSGAIIELWHGAKEELRELLGSRLHDLLDACIITLITAINSAAAGSRLPNRADTEVA